MPQDDIYAATEKIICEIAQKKEYIIISELVSEVVNIIKTQVFPLPPEPLQIVRQTIHELQKQKRLIAIYFETTEEYSLLRKDKESLKTFNKRCEQITLKIEKLVKKKRLLTELLNRELAEHPDVIKTTAIRARHLHQLGRIDRINSKNYNIRKILIAEKEEEFNLAALDKEISKIRQLKQLLKNNALGTISDLEEFEINNSGLDWQQLKEKLGNSILELEKAESQVFEIMETVTEKARSEVDNPKLAPLNKKIERGKVLLEESNSKVKATTTYLEFLKLTVFNKHAKPLRELLDNEPALDL